MTHTATQSATTACDADASQAHQQRRVVADDVEADQRCRQPAVPPLKLNAHRSLHARLGLQWGDDKESAQDSTQSSVKQSRCHLSFRLSAGPAPAMRRAAGTQAMRTHLQVHGQRYEEEEDNEGAALAPRPLPRRLRPQRPARRRQRIQHFLWDLQVRGGFRRQRVNASDRGHSMKRKTTKTTRSQRDRTLLMSPDAPGLS